MNHIMVRIHANPSAECAHGGGYDYALCHHTLCLTFATGRGHTKPALVASSPFGVHIYRCLAGTYTRGGNLLALHGIPGRQSPSLAPNSTGPSQAILQYHHFLPATTTDENITEDTKEGERNMGRRGDVVTRTVQTQGSSSSEYTIVAIR